MKKRMMKALGVLGVVFTTAVGLASCAAPDDPLARNETTCGTGTAIIAIYDGFQQRLCGCTEGRSQAIAVGTNLVCTVPINTAITFSFINVKVPHQVLSTGSPTFVSSPNVDPTAVNPVNSHGVKFTAAGTYTYRDAYEAALTGSIVVTP
jgi:hypothetical protein